MTDVLRRSLLSISNIGWLVPAFLALRFGNIFWCAVPMGMCIFSVAYHTTEKIQWEIVDTAAALLFLFCGPVLLVQSSASSKEWFVSICITVLALSLYLTARWYRLRGKVVKQVIVHCAWHT